MGKEEQREPVKIKNAFAEFGTRHNYRCFGCSPFNEIGLQMEFWEAGELLMAKWQPRKSLEGWTDVLHGGIQAALMDELAGWIVLIKLRTSGVTSELNVKYSKPVNISKGEITVQGKVISVEKRLAKIAVTLFDGEQQECASAEVVYFYFPEKIARAKYHYPGHEAFYNK
ncbi:MAG: phenylacetic acid degradation protein [Draconibacterium sp.]|nr:MAG: phenylacetic acid degradation protein [Draconibacterium sp.]PIF06153.1 MAG: phenylacetic acid degradation protein [Draconibacterium sp.]